MESKYTIVDIGTETYDYDINDNVLTINGVSTTYESHEAALVALDEHRKNVKKEQE